MKAYLDHAATSPPREEALGAVRAHLETFGNPSSLHGAGRKARSVLDESRERIAAALRCDPRELVFTSCATEANNLAILGVGRPGRIVTTAIEHPSVLEACRISGRELELVPPGPDGAVSPDAFRARGAAIASMMLVNNETGSIQPVEQVAGRGEALFHCDAVQALGKVSLDLSRLPVDLLTISSHKVGGPKGAGALFVRKGIRIAARTVGGGQEFERRAGTENVAAAAGFAAAVEAATQGQAEEATRMRSLADRLLEGLRRIPGAALNGPERGRAPHIVNVSLPGVDGEGMAIALDAEGVAVSTGSACSSLAVEPSHVLQAMGLSRERIGGSIRFSVGPSTTTEEIDFALRAVYALAVRFKEAKGVR